jgi:CDP-paratose 2-epimerase
MRASRKIWLDSLQLRVTPLQFMKVLITGICGFVGNALARRIKAAKSDANIFGIDNLMRSGSEANRRLARDGIRVFHGDIRCASDIDALVGADWVIDAAANPSVLAGFDSRSSARQLIEHNLFGTVNLLEYCRRHCAGFILLSTSRVYAIRQLSQLPMEEQGRRFAPRFPEISFAGFSDAGIAEDFSTDPPVSLYGSTKRASETLALEYGAAYDFPVWINRCGVLAGAGQFGTAQQGIFSFWLHAWRAGRPLRYIGFGGKGLQVRDAFHPDDLADFVLKQMEYSGSDRPLICNLAGGITNSMSLLELSDWCANRFGPREVISDGKERPFDVPWVVLDSSRATQVWAWELNRPIGSILTEIAWHAQEHPDWLELTNA